MPKEHINAKVDTEVVKGIREHAAKHGYTLSHMIEVALAKWLDMRKPKKKKGEHNA